VRQQVVPYIDGVRYVKKIASESGCHIELVRQVIKHLLYYECITMIDIFQYSNVYVCTPRIQVLYTNTAMQNECRRYVTIPGTHVHPRLGWLLFFSSLLTLLVARFSPFALLSGTTAPSFEKIFALYCGLRPALTFRDFCQDNDIRALNIDDRSFSSSRRMTLTFPHQRVVLCLTLLAL
jgi:hypothetical protein